MTPSQLSQEKIEHAILWSLARENYDGEFADVPTVRIHLLNVASMQQVSAGLQHLVACGLVADRSAVTQGYFEATRDGLMLIDKLAANLQTFVGRLDKHGPNWLRSGSARISDLQSRLMQMPMEKIVEEPKPSGVHVQVSPIINNTNSQSSQPVQDKEMLEVTRSGTRAGWTNVAVAVTVGIIVILVTLKVAGLI